MRESLSNLWSAVRPWLPLKSGNTLKESLEELIEEQQEEGSLKPEEKDILTNLAEFGEQRVSDVMTPRAHIIGVPIDISYDEFRNLVLEHEHTRYPIFRRTLDDVLGFIHIKDLVAQFCRREPFNLRQIVHQVLFVPPSMPVMDLLVKMRGMKAHIALVVDEFGGTMGLVTLEDIVEEIVGEIEDEHDVEETLLLRKLNGVIDVSARVSIEDVEKELDQSFGTPENREYDTVAGFIFELLGRVPATGEIIRHDSGYQFEIKDSDMRSIKRVLIRKIDSTDNAEKKAS